MVGVNVSIKGTRSGTNTDVDGIFSISVPTGAELVFSFLGYREEIFKVKKNEFVRIVLSPDNESIEETVIVGYGKQKKASSVGSISTAKGEDLSKAGSVNSISEALQGQMPGVVAMNTNSKPGADNATLLIRGKSTWGNTSPLVLVDGVERDFNDVDVNEVESISVLKDASATAVYGVKGANGVILLTTKRGENKKTSVNFSANVGFKQPSTKFEWADYMTGMRMFNEAAVNDERWDNIIPESTFAAWENAYNTGNYGPYNDIFPEVDWWGEITKNFGLQQNYNLNVRGGSDKVTYFASVGYLNDGDIFNISKQNEFDPRFWYKRYNWRVNIDYNITKTTKLSVNVAGNMSNRNQPGFRDPSDDKWIFQAFYRAPGNMFPIKYSDGHFGSDSQGANNIYAGLNYQGQRTWNTLQGFYDFSLNQDLKMITKGLSVRAALSFTTYQMKASSIMKAGIYGIADSEAQQNAITRIYREYDYSSPIYDEAGNITGYPYTEKRFPVVPIEEDRPVGAGYNGFGGFTRYLYYELALNYAREFKGGHNVTALALFNRREGSNWYDYPTHEEAWVGRVTYNWKERYLMEINAAYTGSEKFAPGQRFGFFPSFSVGWRLTEEPWMANIKKGWLNNLKIRYSYGQIGSDRGAPRFNYIQLYNRVGNVTFGKDQNIGYGPVYSEGALANVNTTWETSTKHNLGLEMTLFDNFRITLDMFDEHRDGILMSRQTNAPWIGKALPAMNIGKTKSHGLELALDWADNIGKDFSYYARFNFATTENRIVFRDDPNNMDQYMKFAGRPIGCPANMIASGNLTSIDDIFNYSTVEVNKVTQNKLDPGDLAFLDYNADGVINDKDKVPVDHVGYPLTTYSLMLGFSYKGFGFSAMFYAATGVYKEHISDFLWDFPEMLVKSQPNTLDRWTPADAGSLEIVRPAVHLSNEYNNRSSNYTYVNHSFLRLKNVELNYSFPKRWIKAVKMSSLQIYANANNLFTVTASGVDKRRDPETGGGDTYPMIRRYNIGVRLGF